MSTPEGFQKTYDSFCSQLNDESLPDKLAVLKALHEKIKAEINAPLCEQIKKIKDTNAELISKISKVEGNSAKITQDVKDKYAAEFAEIEERKLKLENALEAEIELELIDNTNIVKALELEVEANENEINRLFSQKDKCLIQC